MPSSDVMRPAAAAAVVPAPVYGVIVVSRFSAESDRPPLVQRTCGWRTKVVPSVGPMKSAASGSVAGSMKFDQVWPTSHSRQVT